MTQYQNQFHQLQDVFLSEYDCLISRKVAPNRKADPINAKDPVDGAKLVRERNKDSMGTKQTSRLVIPYENEFDSEECELCKEVPMLPLHDKINVVLEKVAAFLTKEMEKFRIMEFVEIVDGIKSTVDDFVYKVPTYEDELWVVASACLFLYGGSWVRLAGLIAATEIFGTQEVLQTACVVGWKLMGEEILDREEDIAPENLKKTFKDLGSHFALILAVLHTNFWAEICVSFACASRLVPIIRLRENFFDITVNKDSDVEWLAFLSYVVAASVSSTFSCFFPRLGIALYMAFVGMECLLKGKRSLCLPTGCFATTPVVVITAEDFANHNHQLSLWLSAAFTALWQSYSDYSGVCLFLSWSMFLLPAIKTLNFSNSFSLDVSGLNLE